MSVKKYIDMEIDELDKHIKKDRIVEIFAMLLSMVFMWYAFLIDNYPAIFFVTIFLCLTIIFHIDLRHVSLLKFLKRNNKP